MKCIYAYDLHTYRSMCATQRLKKPVLPPKIQRNHPSLNGASQNHLCYHDSPTAVSRPTEVNHINQGIATTVHSTIREVTFAFSFQEPVLSTVNAYVNESVICHAHTLALCNRVPIVALLYEVLFIIYLCL